MDISNLINNFNLSRFVFRTFSSLFTVQKSYLIKHIIFFVITLTIGIFAKKKKFISPFVFWFTSVISMSLLLLTVLYPHTLNILQLNIYIIYPILIYHVFIYYSLKNLNISKKEFLTYFLILITISVLSILNDPFLKLVGIPQNDTTINSYIFFIGTIQATFSAFIIMIVNFTLIINKNMKHGISHRKVKYIKNIQRLSEVCIYIFLLSIISQIIASLIHNLTFSITIFISNAFFIFAVCILMMDTLSNPNQTNKIIKENYIQNFKNNISEKDFNPYEKTEYDISILCDDIMEQYRNGNYTNLNDNLDLLAELIMQFENLDKNTNDAFFSYFNYNLHNMLEYFDRENYYEFYFKFFNLLFFRASNNGKYKESSIMNILKKLSEFSTSSLYNNSNIKANGVKKYTFYIKQLLEHEFSSNFEMLLFKHCYGSLSYVLTSYIQYIEDDLVDDISKEYIICLISMTKGKYILHRAILNALNFDLIWLVTSKKINTNNYKLPAILSIYNHVKQGSFDDGTFMLGNLSYLFIFSCMANDNNEEENNLSDTYNKFWKYNKVYYYDIFSDPNILLYVLDYCSMINKKIISRYIKDEKNLIIFFLLCIRICGNLFANENDKNVFINFAKTNEYNLDMNYVSVAFEHFIEIINDTSNKKINKSKCLSEIKQLHIQIQSS